MKTSAGTKKGIVLGAILLVALVILFAVIYTKLMPQASAGDKTIEVEIVLAEDSKAVTIETDTEYLRQALDEKNLISGTESEMGLFITAVDGVEADAANQEWWCITKDGGEVMTGVDSTPIADGDHFELTLMVGW